MAPRKTKSAPKPDPEDLIDRGADGPAAAARPRMVVETERRISPTRVVRDRRTVLRDVLVIDRMADAGQLSDRQYHAAQRLYGRFLAAGLEPQSTARVTVLRDSQVEDEFAEEGREPPEEARLAYRRLLQQLPAVQQQVVDALMYGRHPGWLLPEAQSGLDLLADMWGLE